MNANNAILSIRVDSMDDFFEGQPEIITIRRTMTVKAPVSVHVRLVDNLRYCAGDFLCQVAFLRLRGAFAAQIGDPVIRVNSVPKTLAEVRSFDAENNWGIRLGCDTLTIGENAWMIAGIRGMNWLDSEPAVIEFTLRK